MAQGRTAKGILGSCDHHDRSRGGAMGIPLEDFRFTVEDLAEECRTQEGFEDLGVDIERDQFFIEGELNDNRYKKSPGTSQSLF